MKTFRIKVTQYDTNENLAKIFGVSVEQIKKARGNKTTGTITITTESNVDSNKIYDKIERSRNLEYVKRNRKALVNEAFMQGKINLNPTDELLLLIFKGTLKELFAERNVSSNLKGYDRTNNNELLERFKKQTGISGNLKLLKKDSGYAVVDANGNLLGVTKNDSSHTWVTNKETIKEALQQYSELEKDKLNKVNDYLTLLRTFVDNQGKQITIKFNEQEFEQMKKNNPSLTEDDYFKLKSLDHNQWNTVSDTAKKVGYAAALSPLLTANSGSWFTKKLAEQIPGLALNYASLKGLDSIANGDKNSLANNRYIRGLASALSFGAGSGFLSGANAAIEGSGAKAALLNLGLGILNSPVAGFAGSNLAEQIYDNYRLDKEGNAKFDKNNYGGMILGGLGFGLGNTISNSGKQFISNKLFTEGTNKLADKLSEELAKKSGDTKLINQIEQKLVNRLNLSENPIIKNILDFQSASNSKFIAGLQETAQGTLAGGTQALISATDNKFTNGKLQENHLTDLILPIINLYLTLKGKDFAFWLKRRNHGNSTSGEAVTNIGNEIFGKNKGDDFTGSYTLSKISVLRNAITLHMFNDKHLLFAADKKAQLASLSSTISRQLQSAKESNNLAEITRLTKIQDRIKSLQKIIDKFINSRSLELLNLLTPEQLETAIIRSSAHDNGFGNSKGNEGYVNLEHGDQINNGVIEGQRVLLNADASPELISGALAGVYAGKRLGGGYQYGNWLSHQEGLYKLLNNEFMDSAVGFNMKGEQVPLFFKTPGGHYIVNKGAVETGGRVRLPIFGETKDSYILNNVSGYNFVPVRYGGNTYEFFIDTPGYGSTAKTYQSSDGLFGKIFGGLLDYNSRMHYSTGLRLLPKDMEVYTNTLMNGLALKVKPFEKTFNLNLTPSGMIPSLAEITVGIPIVTAMQKAHNDNIDYKHTTEGAINNRIAQANGRVRAEKATAAMNEAFGTNHPVEKGYGVSLESTFKEAMRDPNFNWKTGLRAKLYSAMKGLIDLGLILTTTPKKGKINKTGVLMNKLEQDIKTEEAQKLQDFLNLNNGLNNYHSYFIQ